MEIRFSAEVAEKLERKHGIRRDEVEEAVYGKEVHVRKTGDVFEFYGRSLSGRYLFVVFRNLGGIIKIITARDMTQRERRFFRRSSFSGAL